MNKAMKLLTASACLLSLSGLGIGAYFNLKPEVTLRIEFDDGEPAVLAPLMIFGQDWMGQFRPVMARGELSGSEAKRRSILVTDLDGVITLRGWRSETWEVYLTPNSWDPDFIRDHDFYVENVPNGRIEKIADQHYRVRLNWDVKSIRFIARQRVSGSGFHLYWAFIEGNSDTDDIVSSTPNNPEIDFDEPVEAPFDLRIPVPFQLEPRIAQTHNSPFGRLSFWADSETYRSQYQIGESSGGLIFLHDRFELPDEDGEIVQSNFWVYIGDKWYLE